MLHLLLLPLCLAASAALGYSALHAFRRRGTRSGLRRLGWALLPIGAYLAGLVTLTSRIAGAVSRWAAGLVFNPLTWGGIGLLAVGVGLLLVTGGRRPAGGRRGSNPATGPRQVGAGGTDPLADYPDLRAVLRNQQRGD